MKRLIHILYISVIMPLLMSSCHDIPTMPDNSRGNFEALWTIINEHYCFLREKGIDWDSIHTVYSHRIAEDMTRQELFNVLASMLEELKDGHTNLSSPWETSYYRQWWSDYPQNYDSRIIEQYYFNFNYRQLGSIRYGVVADNIGYIGYPTFASSIGDGNLDAILSYLATCNGLIIDIRDNGGGDLTGVERLVGRFTTEQILAGYMVHKTGPGRDDFSSPFPYYFKPAPQGRMMWTKPVALLTNRSTFSAANNFVSVMQYLPQVKIVGARTGGGSGMPFSSELPCGWAVRFSACSVLDAHHNTTEFGIEPSPGCAVDLDPVEALAGRDTMLEFAINMLTQ